MLQLILYTIFLSLYRLSALEGKVFKFFSSYHMAWSSQQVLDKKFLNFTWTFFADKAFAQTGAEARSRRQHNNTKEHLPCVRHAYVLVNCLVCPKSLHDEYYLFHFYRLRLREKSWLIIQLNMTELDFNPVCLTSKGHVLSTHCTTWPPFLKFVKVCIDKHTGDSYINTVIFIKVGKSY